jgi:hypothetical protein
MHVRIASKSLGRDLYAASCELEGSDWASGAVVLLTPSPVIPFSVAVRSLLVKGRIAPERLLEEVPWQS